MSDKDYSQLRPFDLEAAKQGEPICAHHGHHLDFVAADGKNGMHCVRIGDWDARAGRLSIWSEENLRMAQLAWVEGKPVYAEDDLYHIGMGQKVTVKAPADNLHVFAEFEIDGCVETSISALTWNPPKVKREGWVNIYCGGNAYIYDTEHEANKCAANHRIACVRIEWEE